MWVGEVGCVTVCRGGEGGGGIPILGPWLLLWKANSQISE